MADEAPLQLKQSRSRAEEVINRHLEEGRKLLSDATGIGTQDELPKWNKARRRWIKLATQGLKTLFSNSEPAEEFQQAAEPPMLVGGGSEAQNFEWAVKEVDQANNVLESLLERLEYLEAPGESGALETSSVAKASVSDRQIFVVHGHADDVKEAVCRLLEKTGDSKIVILHEQPSEGRTIIEKFEDHAGASDHAVVLLTADDVGGEVSDGADPDLRRRGRQNVVFELGFFVGRLGRARVTVLYEEGIELPSDFKGVVYIPIGDDSWRYKLLQELRGAGLDFDLNKIPT